MKITAKSVHLRLKIYGREYASLINWISDR